MRQPTSNAIMLYLVILLLALSSVEGGSRIRSKSQILRPNRPQRAGRRNLKNSRSGAFEFAVDNEGMPLATEEFAAVGVSKGSLSRAGVAGVSKGTFAVSGVTGVSKGTPGRSQAVNTAKSQNLNVVTRELPYSMFCTLVY